MCIGLRERFSIQIELACADSYDVSTDCYRSFDVESAVIPGRLEDDNVASLQIGNGSVLKHPVPVKERALHGSGFYPDECIP